METGKISDNFSSLTENVKEYIHLQIDFVKLVLTEKLAKLTSFFLIAVIFFILAMFLLLFLSLAFVFWFGEIVGPTWIGALIVTAVYILGGAVVYFQREKLFINPLVSHLTKILMEEEQDETE
ncbi:MAG: phage holin family protein [Bacteroidales bacterium]|nr:phage holin family protein [Bacteroidales bacterium]MDD4602652.1 phage holin family protein [Bacteroidales bacterium]